MKSPIVCCRQILITLIFASAICSAIQAQTTININDGQFLTEADLIASAFQETVFELDLPPINSASHI